MSASGGGVCTSECSSNDDCASMAEAYCVGGYECGVVDGYPRKICVCGRR